MPVSCSYAAFSPAFRLFLFESSGFNRGMKYLIHVVRILLGLAFVVFGANAFLLFIPGSNQIPPGQAGAFIGALSSTGYFHVIAVLQILGGLCLLSGRLVPLGLTLLGPIIVNIVLFHIFLEPQGLPIAAFVSILALFLLWVYRYKFPAIFQP
jgi:putative oxidoreductase